VNRFYTLLLLTFFAFTSVTAQKVDIEIKIDNYMNDTLIVGNYYADRQLVKDTLIRKSNEKSFRLEADSLFESGVYIAITIPDHQFSQFIIPEDDQEFEIQMDYTDLSELKSSGSDENKLFYDYLRYLNKRRPENIRLQRELMDADSLGMDVAKINEQIDVLDLEILEYQEKLVTDQPTTITAALIAANFQVDIPKITEGTPAEIQAKRFRYYREHYFDNVNFNFPAIIRTPFLHDRIEYYMQKLNAPLPDSTIIAIDYILSKFTDNEEALKFYTSYFLNQYAQMKMVGQDAIYVHIVDKYYANGKAPWVKAETLAKIVDNANKLKPLLIGNTIPDVTTYEKDGTAIKIRDIEADYTVLVFWAPNCGHCKKAMPHVVKFNDEYLAKGVKTVSICTKGGEKFKGCWDSLEDKDMLRLHNTGDEFIRFQRKMFVTKTPKIIVLDKNKEIIIKDIPADKLSEVIDEIIRLEDAEKEIIEE